jgi:hypothetical protein
MAVPSLKARLVSLIVKGAAGASVSLEPQAGMTATADKSQSVRAFIFGPPAK